ncbi:hypothetical protein [Agromyces archimandritae]|uniref:Uncharacterized protein n=1 Tax=Agromyces archimandritae TaxID=2781962 RepID=A0A975FLI8_9MICO|nr:hypothetical protein [Agromyces archimandritae]QTX04106.1 hypothetical protein G127AT_12505 [Agromyces archimandritae]
MSRNAQQALAWAEAHPTRDGGTWSQWCQSLIVRALDLGAAGDAHQACTASKIVSTDPAAAPAGALHWWLNGAGTSGHVALEVGGGEVLMTDAPTGDQWPGHNTVGVTTVARYNAKGNGYRYVGWSRDMAGQALTITTAAPAAPKPATGSIGPVIRSGSDWAYRRPAGELAKRVARALIARKRLPAAYPNDGDPREAFDTAVQKTLSHSGSFIGRLDGKIERGGCYGIQDYAARFGDYTKRGGIQDGKPEALSWECFALGLERP